MNSVLINLLPRIGMSRVDSVTSAARSTRRTVCTGGRVRNKEGGWVLLTKTESCMV